MNGLVKSSWLYVEIDQGSLRVLNGEAGLDFPLDRQDNGRLTDLCRERLTRSLQDSLKRRPWQPRLRALCAIGARGVSLRRLTLPSTTNEEFQRLLRLQIESEFPLPPDQLAWGYRKVPPHAGHPNGSNSRQELIVVAVKKEFIAEYSDIFLECGLNPVFTLTAFTRSRISPQPVGSYAVLDVGNTHSEWISFEYGAPNSLRVLPWGNESITRAIEQRLGISRSEAEKLSLNSRNTGDEDIGQKVRGIVEVELDSLAQSVRDNWTGQKIYLSGQCARDLELAPQLSKRLGDSLACEYRETVSGGDRSAAILTLEQPGRQDTEPAPLLIQVNEGKRGETLSKPAPWNWAALAVLLVLGLVSLPYAETFLMKSRLSARLAALKLEKQRLPEIDRELRFLQFLKDNQPPYLEALEIVANATQPGTRFDSISMNRRGDLSLRGFMRDSQQVVDFRSKLIKSGFFSNVVVEEQNPTPDRQKVMLRISAQWKPAPGRESLPLVPAAAAIEKPKTAGKEVKSNAPPEKIVSGPATPGPAAPGSTAPGPNPPP
jgi:Tfp pilus assembly PilM family ATPase